jgi:hypothetical protein
MSKFAVYFVPPASSQFYQLGAKVLGHDVRTQSRTSADENPLKPFDPLWVTTASPYGFHATIGDAIDFDCDVKNVISEVSAILASFKPSSEFILTQKHDPKKFVTFRNPDLVLKYDANEPLLIFHALVCGLVNTLGSGSDYRPGSRSKTHENHRIAKFHSWTILDSWNPHFTILNPYKGTEPGRTENAIYHLFKSFGEIRVDSVCVMLQRSNDSDWIIIAEFERKTSGWTQLP